MKRFISVLLIGIMLQGCAPAMLIGAVGYAVSSGRKSRAEMLTAYSDYQIKMETLNTERQANGMEPLYVSTYEEWYNRSK